MTTRVSDRAPRISEKQIQEACSDFLALDQWRRIRTDLPHLRGMGVQEKGMADDLFLRYEHPITWYSQADPHKKQIKHFGADVLWIEWKRRTGKTAAHQHDWHAAERARGALTLIAGIDFVASVDGFTEWYMASGLARRVRPQKQVSA